MNSVSRAKTVARPDLKLVPSEHQTEIPTQPKQVWRKPVQGEVLVVYSYLEDIPLLMGRYVIGRPWQENSPSINVNGWYVPWSEIHAHLKKGRAYVIYK